MEQHVVGDVVAGDKSRLGDGQDVVGRAAHAQSEDARSQLVVAVEEGGGALYSYYFLAVEMSWMLLAVSLACVRARCSGYRVQ